MNTRAQPMGFNRTVDGTIARIAPPRVRMHFVEQRKTKRYAVDDILYQSLRIGRLA